MQRLVSVHERKTSDHFVISIEPGRDKVLRVVTKKFEEGEHSKTSVLKLLELALLLLVTEVGLSKLKVTKNTPVVNGSDEENNLCPSKSRDVINGGNSVGDVVCRNSWCDIETETVSLGSNVSKNGERGSTTVFELGGTVFIELFL